MSGRRQWMCGSTGPPQVSKQLHADLSQVKVIIWHASKHKQCISAHGSHLWKRSATLLADHPAGTVCAPPQRPSTLRARLEIGVH